MGGLYTYRWQQARKRFLAEHPLCTFCQQEGRLRPATVVDHVIAHKGNEELFWDAGNWAALCAPCHDRHKQRQERSGRLAGCDVHGNPLDPNSHWNKGRGRS